MNTLERILGLLEQYPADAHVFEDTKVKPNGELRQIAKPNKPLRIWLRAMNKALNAHFIDWPTLMHGNIRGRSYVTHAKPHVDRRCVITVDIKDCFSSIPESAVAASLSRHLGLDLANAQRLAHRLCFKGSVPQGFPTSGFMCNLYLLDSLIVLERQCAAVDLRLTNYVDDVAISGHIDEPDRIISTVAVALSQIGLKLNKKKDASGKKNKIRIMPSIGRQVICGLLVNKRISLTGELKRQLLGGIAHSKLSASSVDGWIACLKNIDPRFRRKLYHYARQKGLKIRRLARLESPLF